MKKDVKDVHFDDPAKNVAIMECLTELSKSKGHRMTVGAILNVALEFYDCEMPPDILSTEYSMVVNELLYNLKKTKEGVET